MMDWLPRLVARVPATIHGKLLVAFFSIIAMFVVLGAVGLWVLRNADERAAELIDLQRQVAAYQQLQSNTTELLYAVTSAFLITDERTLEATLRRVSQFAYDFDRAEFVGRRRAELIEAIQSDYAQLIRLGTDIISIIQDGDQAAARVLQTEQAAPLADRIARNTYTLINIAEAEMLSALDAGNRAFFVSQVAVVAIALASVLLALLLGYALSSSLIVPIKGMNERFKAMAAGELSGRLEVANRDELGELAEDLNRMSAELDRLYRQLEAASRHKSDFVATVSHEIRTPLNAVIGMSGLLLESELSTEQRDFCTTIRDSAHALLAIVNDILDFSKVEAGKLELEARPFRLDACIEGALGLVGAGAAGKGLKLACLIEDGVPGDLVGDPNRVRQIVLNLLSNAIKFTDRGEIVVTATHRPRDDPANGAPAAEIEVSVRDTGVGIPPAKLDRLFQSFSQADASVSRRYGGSGLGLAISKRLCELMGGRIWVESEVGRGSAFHFTMVLPIVPGGPTVLPELRGRRVLVAVLDDDTCRRILVEQLRAWDMVPSLLGSSQELESRCKQGEAFDLAIVSLDPADAELARTIQEQRPQLPRVYLLPQGSEAERQHVPVSAGEAAAVLGRPVLPSKLMDALADLFFTPSSPTAEPATAEKSPFDASMASLLPLRILVADDHATNRKLAHLILARLGYRSGAVADGREVLAALEREPYDVVLMDVHMPNLDGLEATREIRRRWPASGPFVIAVTANATRQDRELCLAAGMDDYVSKPIQVDQLVAALKRCRKRPGTTAVPAAMPADERRGEPSGKGMDGDVLDPAALDALRKLIGDDERALAELIESFLEAAPALLEDLRRGLAEGDAAGVLRSAHTIKSSARDFGATRLADLCQDLENVGRSGDLTDAPARAAALESELARVRKALEVKVAECYQPGLAVGGASL